MMFDDEEEKFYLNVSFTSHGRTYKLNAEYDEYEQWGDILKDIVSVMESAYGYSFDLEDLGIWYKGKGNDD